jgi:hypothetical protein
VVIATNDKGGSEQQGVGLLLVLLLAADVRRSASA